MTSPGNIPKTFNGIKSATVPDSVGLDFVKTILKIPGGSGNQMNSFLKKLGFADANGKPTEVYTKFRNPTSSGAAMAKAIRHGYAPLYLRNEYMHELSDSDLLGLIVEETGLAHDSNPVKLVHSSIKYLKDLADFSTSAAVDSTPEREFEESKIPTANHGSERIERFAVQGIGLNLGYTINLNLPATSDPAVFNAIFKSLKEHLLSSEDG